MAAPLIEVRDLVKCYGSEEVVRGVDLEVAPGEIFAVLGPNGQARSPVASSAGWSSA